MKKCTNRYIIVILLKAKDKILKAEKVTSYVQRNNMIVSDFSSETMKSEGSGMTFSNC